MASLTGARPQVGPDAADTRDERSKWPRLTWSQSFVQPKSLMTERFEMTPLSPPRAAASPCRQRFRTLVACTLLTAFAGLAEVHAETVRVGGTGSAIGTMERLGEAYRKTQPSFRLEVVPNLGSSGGIKALSSGAIQIAMTSRPLKPAESATGLRAIEYGRTPFVVATTHAAVKNVSTSELAALYGGQRTRWNDGTPVRLVLRPASDGDSELLAAFSPEVRAALEQAQKREGMVLGMTDQETVDAIERLPGGLGTASMALLLSEKRRALPLAIDGVEPTPANVASGRYPHVKPMYVVLRSDAPEAARRFVDFIGSDAGRKLLAELGHVVPSAGPDAVRGTRP